MIVRRFFDPELAQASYLIACGQAGVAVVIDPNRDIATYTEAAAAERVRITDVTETHIHADFLSGARDLARATGATLRLSNEGGPDWTYQYAIADGARLLKDGDTFMVGNVRVQAVHTPGHTPEHMSFLITDTAAADEPIAIVTGDFVFVGDVGRPDLLERAAKVAGTMEASARTLFRSLQTFKAHPDWLQVWPGHGAGSACGKGLSAVPHSTVGYEKRFNWALSIDDEETFVRAVLEGQPEPPKYFAMMKKLNKEGPAPYDPARVPPRVGGDTVRAALDDGTPVIDTRLAEAFAGRHVRGTVNIPLNRSFNTWAGWLLPYDRDFLLIVDDDAAARSAVRSLAMIGLDRVGGVAFASQTIAALADRVESLRQLDTDELTAGLAAGTIAVVDVRGQAEWDEGHLSGARHIPLGYLTDRLAEIPRAATVVVQCQGGARSMIGASLLLASGVRDVANFVGGLDAWEQAGMPVTAPNANAEAART